MLFSNAWHNLLHVEFQLIFIKPVCFKDFSREFTCHILIDEQLPKFIRIAFSLILITYWFFDKLIWSFSLKIFLDIM